MGLDKPTVQTLFTEVKHGRVLLPDFQRSFVWKAEQIRELIVSLLGKYYVGTFLYMDMVTSDSIFALRLVEGVEKVTPGVKMQSLVTAILDGQQRTTSLFYALAAPDLPLKGKKGGARFFLNIPAMLRKDWDAAVSYVAANNNKALSLMRNSPHEIETVDVLVPTDVAKSLQGGPYEQHAWDIAKILNDFLQYQFNHVELPKSTPLERVVETFQRINEHVGEPLSIKDLLVARLYKSGIKFRDLLEEYNDKPDTDIDADYLLKVMALVRTGEVRRKQLLTLSPVNFKEDWSAAQEAASKALNRMLDRTKGYGVLSWRKAPSKNLIVVLSSLLMEGARRGALDANAFRKIDAWYWVSVFADRYDAAVNTVTAADWKETKAWVFDGGNVPEFIHEFDASKVDFDVTSRSNAVYRGTLCLFVLAGAHDFKTNQPPHFDPRRAQDDHIFPKSQFHDNRVVVRTLITTNQSKSNLIPSVYFGSLEKINGRGALVSTLATHLISEVGLDALLSDDKDRFVLERKAALRVRVSELTSWSAS